MKRPLHEPHMVLFWVLILILNVLSKWYQIGVPFAGELSGELSKNKQLLCSVIQFGIQILEVKYRLLRQIFITQTSLHEPEQLDYPRMMPVSIFEPLASFLLGYRQSFTTVGERKDNLLDEPSKKTATNFDVPLFNSEFR